MLLVFIDNYFLVKSLAVCWRRGDSTHSKAPLPAHPQACSVIHTGAESTSTSPLLMDPESYYCIISPISICTDHVPENYLSNLCADHAARISSLDLQEASVIALRTETILTPIP